MDGPRASDLHHDQTAEIVRDLGDAWSLLVRPISIVRTAANRAEHGDCAVHNHVDLNPTAQNDRERTPRSRSDRTAIAARSNRDRKVDMGESLPVNQRAIDGRPGLRSWPDRGQMDGYFGAKLKKNSSQLGPNLKPEHRSSETTPLTLQIRVHDPLNHPRFRT